MNTSYRYTKACVLFAVLLSAAAQNDTCSKEEIKEGQKEADRIWGLTWEGSGMSCATLTVTKESTLMATPYDDACEAEAYVERINYHYELQERRCDGSDDQATDRTGDICPCAVMINDLCTTATFAEAVENANYEDVIGLSTTFEVTTPIVISTSVTLVGIQCGDSQGTLIAAFPQTGDEKLPEVAMLYTQEYVSITLDTLIFQRKESGPDDYGTALYADSGIGLNVVKCGFVGLRSPAKGAAAIYVKTAEGSILIDSDSYFTGNSVSDAGCVEPYCVAPWGGPDQQLCPDHCFGGGGALWVNGCYGSTEISIQASFQDNYLEFGHGMGGAIFMDWTECQVTINGDYTNNTSADGGAIHIEGLQGSATLNVDGHFTANHAIDGGWKGRGAAVRVREIAHNAECIIQGLYEQNTVENGRGAVIATNNMLGHLTIDATAVDNECDGRGGLISNLYDFTGDYARLTMRDTCVFTGNTATSERTVVLNFEQQDLEMSEAEWEQQAQIGDYEVSGGQYPSREELKAQEEAEGDS